MASTIKGINVKIGADTTALTSALKDVDKKSRSMSRELRKINRGLRFNPKSTELLAQKQDVLGDKISTVKDRLDTLRKAQDDVEKQFKKGDLSEEKYRAFRREIVQTESKLEYFTDQLEDTQKESKNLGDALDDLKGMGNKLKIGMEVAGAAIAAVGTAAGIAIKQTADYAKEVDNAADAANVGVEDFQNLSYALKGVGLEADDVSELLVEVNRVLGEAQSGDPRMTQALNSIGLEVRDLKDLNTYDLFIEIANGLSEMESQADKTAVSGVLLGEDLSRKLLPVLDDSKTSIKDLAEEAEDMDLALSEDDIEGWREFERTFRQITEQVQAIKRDMATDLLPFLQTSLLPYFENDLLPVLTDVFAVLADIVGMPFSYEGGDEIAQEIKDIETLAEAESTLAEKQAELEQNRLDVASMALGGSSKKRKELTEEQKILEDQISLLEYRIKYWNLLNQSADNSGGGGGGEDSGEEGGNGSGPSAYEQFIEGLNQDIEDYEFEKRLSGIVKDYQKEVEKLQRDKQNQLSLIDTFDISDEEAQKAKTKVKQLYNDMIADVITKGREKWKEEQKEQEKEREEKREKELQAEKELQREILENRFEMNDLSEAEYRQYLRDRLAEYDKYTDEWVRIRKKIDKTLQAESDTNDYSSNLVNLGRMGRNAATGYKGKDNTKEQVQSINWMTSAFADMGVEIEDANQKFVDWKDELVTGLSDAIVRAEDLGEVFDSIADQIASMVMQKAIIGPIVDIALSGMGLPTAHTGGYVSPAGKIIESYKFHSGGGVGLRNDEVPAVLQTGEYVLNRDQVNGLRNGGASTLYDITINAIDSQSFQQAIQKNPEAIISVVSRDILHNGAMRKAIKKS